MDASPKVINKDFYICLKRSVNNPDLASYQSDKYLELVAKDLNTGIEKHIFDDYEKAQMLLTRQGTQWNLCTLKLPVNKIGRDERTQNLILTGKVTVGEIKEIKLHPLLSKSIASASKKPS